MKRAISEENRECDATSYTGNQPRSTYETNDSTWFNDTSPGPPGQFWIVQCGTFYTAQNSKKCSAVTFGICMKIPNCVNCQDIAKFKSKSTTRARRLRLAASVQITPTSKIGFVDLVRQRQRGKIATLRLGENLKSSTGACDDEPLPWRSALTRPPRNDRVREEVPSRIVRHEPKE